MSDDAGPDPTAMEPALAATDDEDYRIVVVHPALLPDLERWLATRGLEMRRSPMGWIITPTDETLGRVQG